MASYSSCQNHFSSPKAALSWSSQVALSSYFAKNGRCTQSGLRLLDEAQHEHLLEDNRDGVIGSQQALNLSTTDLDNSTGLINSQGDLTLDGQKVDSSQGGEISAKGDLKPGRQRSSAKAG